MILTKAIAGIARSNATRAGYPVLVGQKVPLYALSNVGRSGATRSNYVGTRTFISVGGVQRGAGILSESLTKSDQLNATPDTIAFTARGWIPVEGADVVITRGSINNPRREFGGTILRTTHRYVGQYPIDRNMLYDVSCIDYTWGLDRRKVSGDYKQASIGAIAASLLTFAPGYTLLVDPDIAAEILDEITFTEQAVSAALTQLVKRVGGDYLCDYSKVVHLFFSNTAITPPGIVNAVHPTLADIAWTRDLSQVVTRVLGNFGGSTALDAIGPGETLLPVETAAWYLAAGGTVLVDQQRVTYGGIVGAGGGSLVGPGASPTGAPNVSLQPGAGVDIGTHDYAVSFKTAAGESLPGPRVTVPVGLFLAPTAAPTPGTPGPGASGPDPGAHDYAVSFVITGGETVPGPRVAVSTTLTPPPDTGPTPDRVDVGPGPDPGQHDYAITFATATGETSPSPIGGQITTGPLRFPDAPTASAPTLGNGPDAGNHVYAVTFTTASGETTIGYNSNYPLTDDIPMPPPASLTVTATVAAGGVVLNAGHVYYYVVFVTAAGTTMPSPVFDLVIPAYNSYAVQFTLPLGPVNTTARLIYAMGATTPGQTGEGWTVNDNTTATYTFVADADYGTKFVWGYSLPTANTAGLTPRHVITLTNIPIGPSGVTGRKLYRSKKNVSTFNLLATLANNSATTYVDTIADAALGAAPPAVSTAAAQTVHVADLQRGSTAGGATARKLYRRSGGAGLRFVATIADNTSSTYTDTTPNASLGAAPPAANTATLRVIPLTAIPLGNSLVLARKVYRTPANTGGGTLKLVATIADNTTTAFTDTVNDAALGAAALTVGTAQAAQVALTAIPLGAAAVTARVIYRTKAGASQLQIVAQLNNNVITQYLDTQPDATLGANAPTSDTSTLQQPSGNVLAGSATLPCASVAAFPPSGGWAIVGSQNVRYTGISGNALLGIPATGPGAITATINWNTTAVAAAMLTGIPATGIGAIRYQILKGDPVNLFVQVDDLDAQAAVRAQLPGSDGIIEDEIQDGRLSYTEGRARCQARLDLLGARDSDGKVGVVTVSYICRDTNTQAGATVTVNLGPPINLRGDYLIQRVTVGQFHIPHLPPTYTVEASSLRFTAEDLLRVIRQGGS